MQVTLTLKGHDNGAPFILEHATDAARLSSDLVIGALIERETLFVREDTGDPDALPVSTFDVLAFVPIAEDECVFIVLARDDLTGPDYIVGHMSCDWAAGAVSERR